MKSFVLFAAIAMMTSAAQAAIPTEDISVFNQSAGDYVVDPAAGIMCTEAFKNLNVKIDAQTKSITLTFVGSGTMNDQPTAGTFANAVSLSDETEVIHMPGREFIRTVVEGNNIVTQTRTVDPLEGDFGLLWKDTAPVMTFVSAQRLVLSPGPYTCAFIR